MSESFVSGKMVGVPAKKAPPASNVPPKASIAGSENIPGAENTISQNIPASASAIRCFPVVKLPCTVKVHNRWLRHFLSHAKVCNQDHRYLFGGAVEDTAPFPLMTIQKCSASLRGSAEKPESSLLLRVKERVKRFKDKNPSQVWPLHPDIGLFDEIIAKIRA